MELAVVFRQPLPLSVADRMSADTILDWFFFDWTLNSLVKKFFISPVNCGICVVDGVWLLFGEYLDDFVCGLAVAEGVFPFGFGL